MKKILLTFFIFISLAQIVFADVMPYYINSLRRYGIGFTQVTSPLVMRQTPSNDGKILETLNFDFNNNTSCINNNQRCNIDEVFSAYSTSKKIAFLTTIDEVEDWSLICFNQSQNPVCGWVEGKNKTYTWSEFINIFGKKYGLYLYKDLNKADKILYSAPSKQSNSTGSIEMPKYISPWLVRGNWILVKVDDFASKQKTGWLNFRSDNGKLKGFVRF